MLIIIGSFIAPLEIHIEDTDVGPRSLSKNAVLSFAGILLFVAGCQTSPISKSTGMDNAGFMSLWNAYTHCRIASDLNTVSMDIQRLAEGVQSRNGNEGFVLPLPKDLMRLINTPTNRYAVNVRAMASACSLHAGRLALDHGQVDLAREMFTSVVLLQEGSDSSYYLTQAKTQLSEIQRGVDLSLKTP